jgi:molybdopterin converting factor small subunit
MMLNVTALLKVRELLGWSQKAVEFTGDTLDQLLKELPTIDGRTLHEVFVQEDGSISSDYLVWLNCRPVKQIHSLDIPLQPGDKIITMPAIAFRAGG